MVYTLGLIIPLVYCILCYLLSTYTGKSTHNIDRILSGTLFLYYTIFTMLRADYVGTDLHNYIRRFQLIGNAGWEYIQYWHDRWSFEYGFIALNKLLSLINKNERFFIIVISVFTQAIIFKAIKRYSKSPSFSYFVYVVFVFWATSLNLVRLFLSISICLLSLEHIKKNEIFQFCIIVILAGTIHSSALVFLLLYPLSKVKLSNKLILLFITGCVLLNILVESILPSIIRFFSSIYYQRYAGGLGTGSGQGMLMLLIAILAVCYFNYTSIEKKNTENSLYEQDFMREYDLWIKMLMLGIVFNIVAMRLEIAARMMWYFKIGLLFLLPNTLLNFEIRVKHNTAIKVFFLLIIIVALIVYYNSAMLTDNFGITPYAFYWE